MTEQHLQDFLDHSAVDAAVVTGHPEPRLRDDTTSALFILDALEPVTDEALRAARDDLVDRLVELGPEVHAAQRVIESRSQG